MRKRQGQYRAPGPGHFSSGFLVSGPFTFGASALLTQGNCHFFPYILGNNGKLDNRPWPRPKSQTRTCPGRFARSAVVEWPITRRYQKPKIDQRSPYIGAITAVRPSSSRKKKNKPASVSGLTMPASYSSDERWTLSKKKTAPVVWWTRTVARETVLGVEWTRATHNSIRRVARF